MANDSLTELEQRFRENGSVEDEAAWLRARLRAGEVSAEHARLAAALGDPAATRATDGSRGAVARDPRSLQLVFSSMPDTARARALVATGWASHWRRPAAERRAATERALALADRQLLDPVVSPDELVALLAPGGRDAVDHDVAVLLLDLTGERFDGGDPIRASLQGAAHRYEDKAELIRALRGELVPWLLGYGDPVRERVAKRGQAELLPEDLEDA